MPPATGAQVPTLVSDIVAGDVDMSISMRDGRKLGSQALFIGCDGEHGCELWATDGTIAGTHVLSDLFPGPDSGLSNLADSARLNGEIYFPADDGLHGSELWVTDGTADGTRLFLDINPGPSSSTPLRPYSDGNTLYFVANDGVVGSALWTTDGTEAGTSMLVDLDPGTTTKAVAEDFRSNGSLVFFEGSVGTSSYGLYTTDGTEAGTMLVKMISASNSPKISNLRTLGPIAVFTADDDVHGKELWRSDGTLAGTVQIAEINASGSSSPTPLGILGSNLLFSAYDGVNGYQLWKTDGTSAIRVPGAESVQSGYQGVVLGGSVFFKGDNGVDGSELWRSDGTMAGTSLVADAISGSYGVEPEDLVVAGTNIFFVGYEDSTGTELWVYDGTAAPVLVDDLDSGSGDSVDGLSDASTVASDSLVFPAEAPLLGEELWVSDGTAVGTLRLTDVQEKASSSPKLMVPWQGGVAFFASVDDEREHLFESDGTTIGTVEQPFLSPLSTDENEALAMAEYDGKLFFANQAGSAFFTPLDLWTWDGSTALEIGNGYGSNRNSINNFVGADSALVFLETNHLHRTDGAVTGPAVNTEIAGAATLCHYSTPTPFVVLGDLIVYGGQEVIDCELWATDLSDNSSTLIADLDTSTSSAPRMIGTVGSLALLRTGSSLSPYRLWTTDGTADGTELLSETLLQPGDIVSGGRVGTDFLLSRGSASSSVELWKTNGTLGGTSLIRDFTSEEFMHYLGSTLSGAYFQGQSGVWFTDGTNPGTYLVGPGLASIQFAGLRGEDIVLAASKVAGEGRELYILRGTEALFERLPDLEPGLAGTSVSEGLVVGDTLFLSAFRKDVGTELFKVDLSTVPTPPLFADGFESGDTAAWN